MADYNMNEYSKEILWRYLVRKSWRQKTSFINRTKEVLEEQGYPVVIEQGGMARSRNIVVGDVNQAKVIYTAHYDTCPVMPLPNFVTPKNILFYIFYQLMLTALILGTGYIAGYLVALFTNMAFGSLVTGVMTLLFCYQIMAGISNPNTYNDNTSGVTTLVEIAMNLPLEERGKAAFVFFDNEELGLLGSSVFYKRHHKSIQDTPVINFDCVSDGDYILAIANKKMKKDTVSYDLMRTCLASEENKKVDYLSSSSTFYPSDQMKFKKYFGIAAVRKAPILGYYLGRIHTPFDTIYDKGNIKLLSDAMVRFTGQL
jgi:hypothetical protein